VATSSDESTSYKSFGGNGDRQQIDDEAGRQGGRRVMSEAEKRWRRRERGSREESEGRQYDGRYLWFTVLRYGRCN
jgi:hypothetical protein